MSSGLLGDKKLSATQSRGSVYSFVLCHHLTLYCSCYFSLVCFSTWWWVITHHSRMNFMSEILETIAVVCSNQTLENNYIYIYLYVCLYVRLRAWVCVWGSWIFWESDTNTVYRFLVSIHYKHNFNSNIINMNWNVSNHGPTGPVWSLRQ